MAAFGKKTTGTLGDYGAYSSGSASRGNEYRLEGKPADAIIGVVLGAAGFWMTAIFIGEIQYDLMEAWPPLMGLLLIVGGIVMILDVATGKAKFVADTEGIHNESVIFGRRTIAWDDLRSFSLWSVNWNKMVHASGAKKKVTVPNQVLKSKNFELARFMVKFRPDLLPHLPPLMKELGAKKLVPELQSKLGNAVN